jgi:hypothetical protein
MLVRLGAHTVVDLIPSIDACGMVRFARGPAILVRILIVIVIRIVIRIVIFFILIVVVAMDRFRQWTFIGV